MLHYMCVPTDMFYILSQPVFLYAFWHVRTIKLLAYWVLDPVKYSKVIIS